MMLISGCPRYMIFCDTRALVMLEDLRYMSCYDVDTRVSTIDGFLRYESFYDGK